MALDQSALLEVLDALKAADVGDRVRQAAETVYQALIEAELTETIGAALHERTESRTALRNGHRTRTLSTTAGDLELRIPKLRTGSFFPSLLERRRRVDQALFAVVMEAYLHGVSTRKVDDLVKALGADTGISKSEVSRICADLDQEVGAFRDRSLAQALAVAAHREAVFAGAVQDMVTLIGGGYIEGSAWSAAFTLSPETLVFCLVIYGFIASVLPVWMLLAPRDYLSTFMKVGVIALLAVAVLVTAPVLQAEPITAFALQGNGPVFAGSLFPFLFITIACGALSGFHALIASGTTPKMIQKERQVRLIGYGGMLTESFVAIMALIAACIIDPGLYYAMNAPAGLLGSTVQSASQAVANLGFTITPEQLTAAAAAVHEPTLVARTGGAPTLAVGMSQIFSQIFGGEALRAFWYHFAIMFEALFILTTVDAGTRVGRFMLQDTIGNLYRPMRDVSWKPGVWVTSAAVVGAWGYFLYTGVTNPLGGINQLFPLFGIANQLLAAIALTVCTTLLIKTGKVKWAWVTGIPLAWDATVTLTASWQKVFSDSPTLGFFAQRARYQEALDAGKVLAPAKSLEAMQTVVTNSIVDGILAAFFALLVVIIIADAVRVWIQALRSPAPLPTTEAPHTESLITAPSGLLGGVGEDRRELAGTGRRTP